MFTFASQKQFHYYYFQKNMRTLLPFFCRTHVKLMYERKKDFCIFEKNYLSSFTQIHSKHYIVLYKGVDYKHKPCCKWSVIQALFKGVDYKHDPCCKWSVIQALYKGMVEVWKETTISLRPLKLLLLLIHFWIISSLIFSNSTFLLKRNVFTNISVDQHQC